MNLSQPLIPATLVKRYKRFLADVILPDGSETTVHCANPGAMTGLADPGARVWLSRSSNPKRKLPLSWEMTELPSGLVGINTGHANRIVGEALVQDAITELKGYRSHQAEVRYADNSRIDFLLQGEGFADCYLEVKSVTLCRAKERAEFPDAVTVRGRKHLEALASMAHNGYRAVMLFLVQRSDCSLVGLAEDIDPAYAEAFRMARRSGVEAFAYCCKLDKEKIVLDHGLRVHI
ncbi:DNA/RNA nuclease SfsA [Limibacillus sp. MBR-115]|jgi:sugar fermentation stimulation protein A|uniref:DNA/RNA nuclease SfsA n=1 Tax=Limibacillus sp. MBR-115 TaxID=3156465 RepID=UPI0033992D62